MTQEQLGVALGKSFVTISRWETGQSPPSEFSLLQLAQLARTQGEEDLAKQFELELPKGSRALAAWDVSHRSLVHAIDVLDTYREASSVEFHYWKIHRAVLRAYEAIWEDFQQDIDMPKDELEEFEAIMKQLSFEEFAHIRAAKANSEDER